MVPDPFSSPPAAPSSSGYRGGVARGSRGRASWLGGTRHAVVLPEIRRHFANVEPNSRRLHPRGGFPVRLRRGAVREALGGISRLILGRRATPAQQRTARQGKTPSVRSSASWSVNRRVRRSLSPARRQLGTGGSRDLALSFSIWAITSSRLAHPCRYRQIISKVRRVGLPPVHRWINRQAMIAQ